MTGKAVGLLTLALMVTSCGNPVQKTSPSPGPAIRLAVAEDASDFPYCGRAMKPGAARAYFQRLKAHLEASDAAVPISFYAEQIGIQSGGKLLWLNRDDTHPEAHALLSNAEWREISERGFDDLKDAGWRGCIQADGKAGFQSDEHGELVLSSFDKDRAWAPSPRDR